MGKKIQKVSAALILLVLAVLFLFPLVLTVTNSFMEESEISGRYPGVVSQIEAGNTAGADVEYPAFSFVPDRVTLEQYYTVLIEKAQFLLMFINSLKLSLPIVFGQTIIAAMAAYAFAKFRFRWRNQIFFIYLVVMLMPYQVTLVPNFIIADRLGLLNSGLSIILPGIFSAFGVFLLKQQMEYIPDAYIEAATVDGANQFNITTRVIFPMSKSGIAALIILIFIDSWNMVEQPLIFLQDQMQHPLSTYLSAINQGEAGVAFAASAFYMLPMLLVYFYGKNYLIEGIQLSGIKG